MAITTVLLALALITGPHISDAAVPAPELLLKRYDGFAWGASSPSILIEMFGDFLCPDTLAGWNNVWKPLLKQFGKDAQFRYHILPLPYHRASFDSSQAALAYISALPAGNQSSNAFKYADTILQRQAQFSDASIEALNHADIISLFANMVQDIGLDREAFLTAYSDRQYDYAVRASWKWGVSKGVHATPTYAINGAIIAEAAAWSLPQWTDVLNSFLKERRAGKEF
eukprot:EG_transcript_24223